MFLHDRAKQVKAWLHGWLFEELVFAFLGVLFLTALAYAFDPQTLAATLMALIAMSPVWLPLYLLTFFWLTWMHYIRYMFWFEQEYVLLEVQLPPEVVKSPKAMEVFLVAIHNAGGESTFIARIWKGSFRPIWSLEIASNEGRVGFYLRTPKGWRNIVEARLYGQYPEAKLIEVEDYAAKIPFNLHEYNLFGVEYTKGGAGALPIKTYIDFGLDKDPDEELKIDPITNTLELLANIGKNEYFWIQYVVKARKKEEWYGFYDNKGNAFIDGGKKEISAMMTAAADRAKKLTTDKALQGQAEARGMTLLTQAEKERMENIERSMSKQVFECGIRVMYLAKKENFVGVNAGAIVRFYDSYRGETNNNSLGAGGRGSAGFDYPWQDWNQIRQNIIRRAMFFSYKHRAFFYVPYDQQPEYLTTEELATLWHFPSSVIKTPGLNRVSSRRAEAPSNLPTLPE